MAARPQDRREFELKVIDAGTGALRHTVKQKGVGPFGEPGRVSFTVQGGRPVLLSKDNLVVTRPR